MAVIIITIPALIVGAICGALVPGTTGILLGGLGGLIWGIITYKMGFRLF